MGFDTIVNGVALGGTSALLAVGISQIFRVTGVLNFAHAGFAMVAAYLYAWLPTEHGWSPWPAAAAAVAVVTVLGTVAEAAVLGRLRRAPFTSKVIVTLGLYVLLQGLVLQTFGFDPKSAPLLFSGKVELGSAVASTQQIAILAAAVILVLALAGFLRFTRLGLATRACASDGEMAGMLGIPTRRVSSTNWTIGAALAGVAGVLLAPLATFTIESFSIYLVTGVGAALFGGLTGLAAAFAGGIFLGLAQSWAVAESEQPGIWALAAFGAIFLLVLLRRRWPKELFDSAVLAGTGWRGSQGWMVGRVALVAAWGLLLLKAVGSGFWAYTAALVLVYALISLSVVVSGGWTGQLSLGQGALVGVGVFTMLSLRNDHGVDFVPALLITLVVGLGTGLVYGLLSLRLGSTQVAIVTLALALVGSEWLFPQGLSASEMMPRPQFLDSDRKLLVGLLVVVAAFTALLARLARSHWGRSFSAARDEPDMASYFGVPVRTTRLWGFALSGGIAAVAGVGFALLISVVPPYAVGVPMSINVLVFTVVGGLQSLVGAFIGPLLFVAGPQLLKQSQTSATALPQLFGGLAVVAVLLIRPAGLGSFLRRPASAEPDSERRSPTALPQLRRLTRSTGARLPRRAPALALPETHAFRERGT